MQISGRLSQTEHTFYSLQKTFKSMTKGKKMEKREKQLSMCHAQLSLPSLQACSSPRLRSVFSGTKTALQKLDLP